jgi:nucleoid-associated protein YgaU
MRFPISSRLVLLAMAASLVILAGCSPKVTRQANVSEGDYYSAEEFKNLSGDQRDAYCADLDDELAKLNADAERSTREASDLSAELSGVEKDVSAMQAKYDRAKGEVDGIQDQIDYFEGLPKMHVVEKGEFLQKISSYEKIYNDRLKWPRIYRANKDKIEDPNLIYPGWELTIPRDWPHSWTVHQDEYLSRIASYWEVYGDGTQWTRIYEANRDQVSDPDMIWPDWELTIPRN